MPYECTEAEWKILEILWREGRMSAAELSDALLPQTGWTQHAVGVLVGRLRRKQLIAKDENTSAERYVCRLPKEKVSIAQPAVCMTFAQRFKARIAGGGIHK